MKIQAKHTPKQNSPPTLLKSDEVKKLIIQSTRILSNWDNSANVLAMQHKEDPINPYVFHAEDPSKDPAIFLVTRVYSANVGDLDQFVYSTQFEVQELKIYTRVMQCLDAIQCAKAMDEKLDQLMKNETWVLVSKDEIESGH